MKPTEKDKQALSLLPASQDELAKKLGMTNSGVCKRISRLRKLRYPVHSVLGPNGWRYEIVRGAQ